jgi:hypothetical protein
MSTTTAPSRTSSIQWLIESRPPSLTWCSKAARLSSDSSSRSFRASPSTRS